MKGEDFALYQQRIPRCEGQIAELKASIIACLQKDSRGSSKPAGKKVIKNVTVHGFYCIKLENMVKNIRCGNYVFVRIGF
jgi:hypothetical protein